MIAKGPSDVVSTHPGAAHTALALAGGNPLKNGENLRRIIGKALVLVMGKSWGNTWGNTWKTKEQLCGMWFAGKNQWPQNVMNRQPAKH